jgi:3-hydroxyacyl-CoA dehydrogenase
LGRYGQKTKAGWYKYDDNRRAVSDPDVAALLKQCAAEKGITQREFSAEEIVDRLLLSLVNEGAKILEEGFALRAVDIDIIYINGYGFPAWRGGPMFYADTIGLQRACDRIREFGWTPAPLLERLAAQGKKFSDPK